MTDSSDSRRIADLLRRLKALPESRMRAAVLLEHFQSESPEAVLAFCRQVQSGVARRSRIHLVAMEALGEAILQAQREGQLYELFSEVYRLAREQQLEGVGRMLLITKPQRGPVDEENVPGDQNLSQLTLGERKFLARGHDRQRLERLMLDPDPSVIQNLMRNPHLVERDVVRMAARRPALAQVLRQIFASRWSRRYRVRVALVRNPYTPTDVALKLVPLLLNQELRQAARDNNLHPLIRQAAEAMSRQRRGEPDAALLDGFPPPDES